MTVLKYIFPFLFGCCFISRSAQSQDLVSVIQKGHASVVKSTAYSHDGKYLATASRDKTAKIWERAGGRELRTFFGHQSTINNIIFSPSDKYIATSGADGKAIIWDVETGQELFSTENIRYNTALAFSPDSDWLAIGGTYDQVIIWNWKKRNIIKKIEVNAERGLAFGVSLRFNKKGDKLFIGEDNEKARVFDTKTWEEENTFEIEWGSCGGCVAFGDFGEEEQFYKLGRKAIDRFNLNTGKKTDSMAHELEDVQNFVYLPKTKAFLITTEEQVLVIKTESYDTLFQVAAKATVFNEARCNPNETEIVVSTVNNNAVIYSLNTEDELLKLEGILNYRDKGGIQYDPNNYWSQNIAKYIQLKNPFVSSKDERFLIKARYGKNMRAIDLNSGQPLAELSLHTKAVLSMDLSENGTELVAGDGAGGIFLWDLNKMDTIRSYGNLNSPVFETRLSADETAIISTSWDGHILIWDKETGALKTRLLFENFAAYTTAFTPNDLYFVTAGLNNSLEMYEIDSREKVRSFQGHTKPVSQIKFNKKSQMLTTGWDGSVRIWDLASGLMTHKWQTPEALYAAIFSNDDNQIIVGGADRSIRFYDISTGVLVKTLTGHQAGVVGLQFLNNGKVLISTDLDGTMKFWDLDKAEEIYEHIQINKNEWMVRTPEGYFMGTDKARELVHFVDGMKSYTTDQFFDEYYRPELMQQLFEDNSDSREKNLKGKLKSSPPPDLYLKGTKSNDGKMAYLYVNAISTGGGIYDLRLYHNKKRIGSGDRRAYVENKDTIAYEYELPMLAGENVFEATALSKKGIAAKMQEVKLFSKLGGIPPKCHMLIVGINEYENEMLRLRYARPDAESITELFEKDKHIPYNQMEIHTIYDKDASKKSILDTLTKISKNIALQDVFIFYYAGHGSMVNDVFYFIPSDMSRLFDKSSLDKDALSANELQLKFQDIKALKQVVIMDACQSGASVEVLAQRGLLREKAMAQLSRSTGVHVLAAAGTEQYAMEYTHLGHGLFTYMLLEGLAGKADGAPRDGKVTIYELKSYLDDQVPQYSQEYSGQAQYPYTFSKGNDFPIIINQEFEEEGG